MLKNAKFFVPLWLFTGVAYHLELMAHLDETLAITSSRLSSFILPCKLKILKTDLKKMKL